MNSDIHIYATDTPVPTRDIHWYVAKEIENRVHLRKKAKAARDVLLAKSKAKKDGLRQQAKAIRERARKALKEIRAGIHDEVVACAESNHEISETLAADILANGIAFCEQFDGENVQPQLRAYKEYVCGNPACKKVFTALPSTHSHGVRTCCGTCRTALCRYNAKVSEASKKASN